MRNKDILKLTYKLPMLLLGLSFIQTTALSGVEQGAYSPCYQGYRIVAYTLKTCIHCQRMSEELSKIQSLPGLQLEVVEIQPGSSLRKHRQAQQRAQMAGINGFPTLVIFFNNEKVSTLRGYNTAEAVSMHLDNLSSG